MYLFSNAFYFTHWLWHKCSRLSSFFAWKLHRISYSCDDFLMSCQCQYSMVLCFFIAFMMRIQCNDVCTLELYSYQSHTQTQTHDSRIELNANADTQIHSSWYLTPDNSLFYHRQVWSIWFFSYSTPIKCMHMSALNVYLFYVCVV